MGPLGEGLYQALRKPQALIALCLAFAAGCAGAPGEMVPRRGDEIVVCGRLVHTGAPVVLWTDAGGYDAYRVERRFSPLDESSWEKTFGKVKDLKSPNRYGTRAASLSPAEIQRVRGGGWDLELLQRVVDQFVLHYDVCGTSRECFRVLHDLRGLSVHFMLDLDGTIYQTLDLKEKAWHATIANDRSIGIEIANIGAYAEDERDPFDKWYKRGADGVTITAPPDAIRTQDFVARPIRDALVIDVIQGKRVRQYDFTPQQYDSLIKLTAALCTVFPKIRCDYPRDAEGRPIPQKLPDEDLKRYQGILGHYHIQTNKIDPGPALQWDRVIDGARRLRR